MRMAYTRANDGGVTLVMVAPIDVVRRTLGWLSEAAYQQHVREHLAGVIPADAIDVTLLPQDWEAPPKATRAFWRLRDGKIVVEE